MRKKYFFFDIDRTLGLDISQIIPADTVYCLNRLRQLGHSVAIATGRLQCDGFRTANRYGITSLVSDGGNSLTMNNELIEMNSLPTANCRALLHELERRHLPWAVFTSNTMVRYTPYELFRHLGQSQLFQTVVTPVDIDALTTIYKIVHVRPEADDPPLDTYGLSRLPYIINTYLVEPTDKGAGIRRFMEHAGAPLEDVVVFGDGLNDISMFIPPFFRIAMGNARPQLKERADYITDDNDKGGILHACQKFGWLS
ncbi:HAD hydrolase family protein [uncultured Megasphaera sp.]|jgi:peptidyl-prolyl cis-trans isomerase B (cyclophilin B)|uniref:HAD hydrolase family protein n=1 Tax=uncultured Megasphaera sp. TaxID=165188 RepID=UPI0025E7FF58|nr:HAD hydrolase family protein [uncultured Megasphaera sp.]